MFPSITGHQDPLEDTSGHQSGAAGGVEAGLLGPPWRQQPWSSTLVLEDGPASSAHLSASLRSCPFSKPDLSGFLGVL